MAKNKHELTPAQGQAAQLLADGSKVNDVAEVVKVNRGTIWSWSNNSSWRKSTASGMNTVNRANR